LARLLLSGHSDKLRFHWPRMAINIAGLKPIRKSPGNAAHPIESQMLGGLGTKLAEEGSLALGQVPVRVAGGGRRGSSRSHRCLLLEHHAVSVHTTDLSLQTPLPSTSLWQMPFKLPQGCGHTAKPRQRAK
jgi:hypothetical protein